MKKITDSYSEHIDPVKLFLDDLETIVGYMNEVSSSCEISGEGYEFDSIPELKDLKRRTFRSLSLSCEDPYISLDLSPHSNILYISEDTPLSRGVFELIKKVLHNNLRRRLLWPLNSSFPMGIIPVLGFVFLYLSIKANNYLLIYGSSLLILLGAISISLQILFDRRYHCVIIPLYKYESPSFWKRNLDRIVVSIISSIIGAIIGTILGIIIGRISKSP